MKSLFSKIKINWKVRFLNPYFWIGLLSIIITAVTPDPSTIGNWELLGEAIIKNISNPVTFVPFITAILCYITDHTTKGFSDSDKVMEYAKPNGDSEKAINSSQPNDKPEKFEF